VSSGHELNIYIYISDDVLTRVRNNGGGYEAKNFDTTTMTRGNQRDLAREKAAKRDKGKGKAASEQDGNKGLTAEQRKVRDAEIMRQKQTKKAEDGGAGTSK